MEIIPWTKVRSRVPLRNPIIKHMGKERSFFGDGLFPDAEKPKRRAFDQWKIAGLWRRIGAQALDQWLAGLISILILSLFFAHEMGSRPWFITLFMLWPFASLVCDSLLLFFFKTTAGKHAMGIVVQSAAPGRNLNLWQILARNGAWWVGAFTLGAGWATIFSRVDRRAWHDLVAETVVVNLKGKAQPSAGFERKIGHAWAFMVSIVLMFALASLLQERLSLDAKTKKVSAVTTAPGPTGSPETIEDYSWLLLLDRYDHAITQGFNPTQQKLSYLMGLFAQARQLGESRKEIYYQENMQTIEEELCSGGQALSPECQSARMMPNLLGLKGKYSVALPGAFPVFRVMAKLDAAPTVQAAVEILSEEILKQVGNPAGHSALKTARGLMMGRTGNFKKAIEIFDPQLKGSGFSSNVEKRVHQIAAETTCKAYALTGCKGQHLQTCSQYPFWKDWMQGCNLNSQPARFQSAGQALAYWWNKGQYSVAPQKILEKWEDAKERLHLSATRGFENEVFLALEFAVSAKSELPQGLIEKSKAITKENFLWGWAQKRAVGEFGNQWIQLLSKPDQKLIARFDFAPKKETDIRAVASEKVVTKKVIATELPPKKVKTKTGTMPR
jgi:uncharacterized RDD family membrane protein YckC